MRLQRFLAAAGVDSRRHCEEYIIQGRVTIDGDVVHDLGAKVDPARQEVRLDGELVRLQPKKYYMLNKPQGVVSTHRDPAGRPRAVDLVPQDETRLFTVGRLDESSQGLLIVTNDGELANRLAHPRYEIPRTYHVQVAGEPTRETLEQLQRGLYFAEGLFRVERARAIRTHGKSTFLELVLKQGKNREIRRLLARVGHKVLSLKRVGFGPLRLGDLPTGYHRPLRREELQQLRELIGGRGRSAGRPRSKRSRGGGSAQAKGSDPGPAARHTGRRAPRSR
jgi:23S rRNA pseudouridine2605 synthase